MKKTTLMFLAIFILPAFSLFSQNDKAYFEEYEPGYYQNFILKDVRGFSKKKKINKKRKYLKMDQSKMKLPNDPSLYKTYWSKPTTSQGNTGTCWDFSNTSFYESEVFRLSGKHVKISEMFTVYWEYIEKARRFLKERGNSNFSEGSEGNAVKRIYQIYGAVPNEVFNGMQNGRNYYSHADMFKEMKGFLKGVKKSNAWNEEYALNTIKSILEHHMGVPPTSFTYEGKDYTPKSFLKDFLKLKMDDYIDILSYMQQPYWEKVEYEVPDNWWHDKEYYNVPLDIYMEVFNYAIQNGYTMSIGGDVSEAGFSRKTNCAMIPDFDIAYDKINEYSRQFRFSNKTTTDDHGMHCVGWYKADDGKMWYLIKDSSSGSRNHGDNDAMFGFYFFRDDYVKLKMMDFAVHKDAFKKYINKFK